MSRMHGCEGGRGMRELLRRLKVAVAFVRYKDGKLVAHAKRELSILGDTTMEAHLLDMSRMFSLEGHSGASAAWATSALAKLLDFKPLTPTTGNDDEWIDHGDGYLQNNRCSRVFINADRFGGRPYDIDAFVFREPGGCCYTSKHSASPIEFPYTPVTVYIDVPEECGADHEKEAVESFRKAREAEA